MILKYPVILYDSECPLCRRFKDGMEFLDRSHLFSYLSIRDPEVLRLVTELHPDVDPKACLDVVHLIDSEGTIHRGPEVFSAVAHTLPGVEKLAWLLDTQQGKKALDFFYHHVSAIRDKILKDSDCDDCKKK